MDSDKEKNIGVTTIETGSGDSPDLDFAQRMVSRPTFWPEESEKLGQPRSTPWGTIAFDAVLVLVPVLLIIKIILCIEANHLDRFATGVSVDTASWLTIGLIRFNSQPTTLFTIIFVSVVSSLVRRIALWRAQKGATVAELEQWQASISLPGTLKTIWSLRMYTTTSLALVLLWSWYYLGSQASSREYQYQDSGAFHKMNITVTNARGPSGLDEQDYRILTNIDKAKINAKYIMTGNVNSQGADSTGANSKGYDREGLMRIPFLDQRVSNHADRHGYFEIFKPSETTYTSKIGVQVYAVFPGAYEYVSTYPVVGNLNFDTSYLDVKCAPARSRNTTEFPAGVLPTMSHTINLTTPGDFSRSTPAAFDLWYRTSNLSAEVQAISSTCNATFVPLQIKAVCNAQGCVAKKFKSILTSYSTLNTSVFENAVTASRFFNELLLSTGIPSNRTDPALVEEQLYFPDLYSWVTELDILTALLPANINTTASERDLSITETQQDLRDGLIRMAETRAKYTITPMINTYLGIWQQTLAYKVINNTHGDDLSPVFRGRIASPWLTTGQLDGTSWNPQYAICWSWIAVDFISCVVLLLAGIASAYLRTQILAPDIFGYVSSLTRDNPHVPLPPTGSTLDGFARARLLKNVKVQIAEVPHDAQTGRVCLVQKDAPRRDPVGLLSKEKHYV